MCRIPSPSPRYPSVGVRSDIAATLLISLGKASSSQVMPLSAVVWNLVPKPSHPVLASAKVRIHPMPPTLSGMASHVLPTSPAPPVMPKFSSRNAAILHLSPKFVLGRTTFHCAWDFSVETPADGCVAAATHPAIRDTPTRIINVAYFISFPLL